MAQVRERYVGGGILRKEDPELVTGQASYIENLDLPGQVWLYMVRSPYAHAKIGAIDVSAATAMDGVVAVFTGEDLAGEWAGSLPLAWPVTEDIKAPDHWPVTKDKARYQGDIVAVVVAESRSMAKDAAEAVEVDYEALDVAIDIEASMAADAPLVHEQFGTNASYTWVHSVGDVDAAFASPAIHIRERYVIPRVIANAIEPRGVMVQPNIPMGEITLWSATQIPHILRTTLAAFVLGIPESKLRVISPDVGGGFGSKLNVYAEEAIGVAVARRLGRPTKWTEERSEGYLSTVGGRDMVQYIELAADEDGLIKGVRVKLHANMGAYLQLLTPGVPLLGAFLYSGPYRPEAYSFECTGVFTNTTPTDAYRGAGRPEATYAIERAVDALARKIGKDPAEVRRLNFMPAFDEPTTSSAGLNFDSGDYEPALDKALDLADYQALRSEQSARRERGDVKQLGIGLSSYIEICGIAPSQVLGTLRMASGGWEAATVRVHPTGKVTVITGTTPHGQGHVTSWSQIAADALGVAFEDVEVLHGDTSVSTWGLDTYGSRSLAVGGIAVQKATQKVVEKARRIAAHELEVAVEDVEYEAGRFSVRGAPDRAKTMPEIAFSAWTAHNLPPDVEPSLEGTSVYDPPNFTFPFGTHVCVVEIDTETGTTEIVKYVAVDDCGNLINPIIVEGQVHGGIAQGIAETLFEEAIYDENGQLLTSSMTNYEIPAASDLPSYIVDRTVTPSTTNELGVKGVGEAATIAAPPAVINAVVDALSHLGVTDMPRPATPERVWRAIHRRGSEEPAPEAPGAGSGLGSAARVEHEEGGAQ